MLPQNSGNIFSGQLLCKIWAFFGQRSCKIREVGYGKYPINSSILTIFRTRIMQNSGSLLIFRTYFSGKNVLPPLLKLTELLRLWPV